jgi:hypothetical protein
MSNNAVIAHNSGELPATAAAKEWGFKSAKAVRAHFSPSSWHHTSKFFNGTDFFRIDPADLGREEMRVLWPSLTRRGKTIWKPFILSAMWEAVLPATSRHRAGDYARRVAWLAKFGLGAENAFLTDLSEANLRRLAAAKQEAARLAARKTFLAKLVRQRDCSRPVLRHSTKAARINALRWICGDHGANRVECWLHRLSLPLTEANWRQAHAALYPHT